MQESVFIRAADNGKTWQYLGLPASHHIGKVQLHPDNNDIAWVAVLGHLYSGNKERGVYKTTDGGKTWKQTLFIDEQTGVVDMDLNPSNPLELYAAAWYRIGQPGISKKAAKPAASIKAQTEAKPGN